ncbi:MAG: 5'/3'-nucleotidase SurE [Chloroflexi bacterium]|nr:5'/3'-nucleotidase SurE [Chloroflexota bacterium]
MQILLTNDDGIRSPGLWAAAEALSALGWVTVVAPREQSSGAGRSLPSTSDGIITEETITVHGKPWKVYAVGGTPAQAVQHGVLEIMPQRPDLVVSGINYGENLATGVTISGTVGAALEGAALGIPAMAISLETPKDYHFSYSTDVDFSTAAYFTRYFAERMLSVPLPDDVYVLKVDVPWRASKDTPWRVTRLSRKRYYRPVPPERKDWSQPGLVGYEPGDPPETFDPESDVYAVRVDKVVSVTPLSLDLTSRVDLKALERLLKG